MAKFTAIFMIVVLLAFIGYKQFNSGPRDERSAILQAVSVAKKDKPLKPEEEALLKVQLAIVDHSARVGSPPSQLQDLAPTYFDTVPVDPLTGKEFPYESDGKTYRLGNEVAAAEAQGTDQKTGAVTSTNKTALLENDTEFVNPNTLKEDNFVYDSSGKRDPFMPWDNSPKKREGVSPLEQFDLGELRFTAVISKPNGGKMAFVEDATGRGYPVEIGTKIGLTSGEVVDIQEMVLKVLETTVDAAGRVNQKIIEKKLISANEDIKKSKVKASSGSLTLKSTTSRK